MHSNVRLLMRERGKIVPGSLREGHNVFTTLGKELLTQLMMWNIIDVIDVPYSQKRLRWIALGSSTQQETEDVVRLVNPLEVTTGIYLAALETPSFPTATSICAVREFAEDELSITGPVIIREAGLLMDVNAGLDPAVSSNEVSFYKTYEGLVKTQDFTLEIRWDLRF
jgi:hypothetical protein